ncbi:hypothetical protein GLI01_10550 [Gluconacetobacter liquefaciens]|uniref:Mutator family transposase n=1 Tax=Gluconacetobacter liquefaciens TaxID=89584 RepID=A0A370G4C9_GLULI|nr:transposase [Gluconacetobacter liquefaciens]MBB2186073.1 hypothetical protein [Gluconacetobacter liquefaciens]RDI38605.1 mutator family transposase [Gluconacetobacter liquefaciens]GBQ99009.1 hypothetical protein AA0522_1170 [Gluconacetobacter liquefaciens NRIC 0522]GEB37020.1 hypothetical protein GLI01_10550 [Gluconacetobacter liquefaciens]
MTRIAPIQPESVPISFPGAESDTSKAGTTPSGVSNRSDNSPISTEGDTVTLSPEAIAALALLSAEAPDGPALLPSASIPPNAFPADADHISDPDTPPVPAGQIFPTADEAMQAGMDQAFFMMATDEEMSNPTLRERAYERTLMSALDQTASPTSAERTVHPPNQGQTASTPPNMAESSIRATETKKILAERLLDSGLDENPGTHLLTGRHTDRADTSRITQAGTDAVVTDLSRDLSEKTAESLAPEIQYPPGIDERMVAMYAPPMGNRTIREPVPEDEEPHPEPTAGVTAPLLDTATAWQGRRLSALYPVIFLDTLSVRIRDDGIMRDKPVHLVLGMRLDGTVDILGLWIEHQENPASAAQHIMGALKQRGVEDILMAVVDEHDGFPAAIHAAFPQAQIHPSIDDLLHHLPDFVALQSHPLPAGKMSSATLADSLWGQMLLSATNAIKAMHAMLRQAARAYGHFPNDQTALAFLFMTLNAAGKTVS